MTLSKSPLTAPRLPIYVVCAVFLMIATSPVFAWEFSMKGEFEYRYRYISRTGNGDLFGDVLSAQGAGNQGSTIGLAGPAGGAVIVEGFSVRGSDAAYAEQRLDLYPEIRLNKAVRWRGVYSVQGSLNGNQFSTQVQGIPSNFGVPSWADPQHYAGWAFADSRPIAGETAFAIGAWRDSWVTAQTPWGIIAVGRRPSQWGLGWSTLAQKDIHSRSVAVIAPYGPITIVLSHYLHDSGEDADPWGVRNVAPSAVDQNEVRNWNAAYAVRYSSGNFETGTLSRIVAYNDVHGAAYPAGISVFSDATQSVAAAFINGTHINGSGFPVVGDLWFLLQVTYAKLRLGNAFLNVEYDIEYADSARKGGRPVSGLTQAWMAEAGFTLGPTKVTAAHFFRSGHDRRGGLLAPSSPVGGIVGTQVFDKWNSFLVFAGGDEAIKPYQFLMGLYGAGNNSYDAVGYCTFNDFVAYGGRIDHAVAANLNLWSSFLYALRQSGTGTYIGQFGGGGPRAATVEPAPNVPDDYLGWEVNAGLDWKLLEGLTFNGLFGIWQPGDWFRWAYVDQGSPATVTISDPINGAVAYNVNPNRDIDPIFALQAGLLIDF